jgi:co-chaperonin GroES (HSP10)
MLEPVRDLVMVEKQQPNKTTASGIVITADPAEATKSTVLAVGPNVSDQIKVGDTIILDYNQAWRTKYDGKDYYFVPEKSVIGVLDI